MDILATVLFNKNIGHVRNKKLRLNISLETYSLCGYFQF